MPDALTFPVLAGVADVLVGILTTLVWAVWVVLNLWLFQKTKAIANLLMLVAAAYITLESLVGIFGGSLGSAWLLLLAMAILTLGFFLSVRAQVEAQLAKMRQRLSDMTTGKKDAATPPAAGGPPPAPPTPPAAGPTA